jgi:hypothetical protein
MILDPQLSIPVIYSPTIMYFKCNLRSIEDVITKRTGSVSGLLLLCS